MNKSKILLALILLVNYSFSQVRVVVNSVPNKTSDDDTLYFASNINNWNPKDKSFIFQKSNSDNSYYLDLELPSEQIFYKITRGGWSNVESNLDGSNIDNRVIQLNDSIVEIKIDNWLDYMFDEENTLSSNVSVFSDSIFIPQLNRKRRIWVYLPPSYSESDKKFPVIYMHDGQNLFNHKSSFYGEWEVDETMDKIFWENEKYQAIIVGIDNGEEHRVEELTPFVNKEYGGGKGKLYMEFIVNNLKPLIDANYRTLNDRDNTFIAGSSLGGLISLYGVMSFKDVFSGAGILSPSLWFNNKIYYLPQNLDYLPIRLYISAGDKESSRMISDISNLEKSLIKSKYPSESFNIKIIKGGKHNEDLWRQEFEEMVKWLLN
jgi:predicted alpha/beta superfamily hydrolase